MLQRSLSFTQATALNMIDMVGIGPFAAISLVIGMMQGPQCMLAWIVGMILAFVDANVWSELGAKFPQAGGTYNFLRESFPNKNIGKYLSFLFIWQTTFQAPLVVASAAIGLAEYAQFLVPMEWWQQKLLSASSVLLVIALVYNRIEVIGKISVALGVVVVSTLLIIIASCFTHFNSALAFSYPAHAFTLDTTFFLGLGLATAKCTYCYLGYYNVCHVGSEIEHPEQNIPRSMFISIAGIAVLYLALQLGVLGVIPWQEATNSKYLASIAMQQIYGDVGGIITTILVLTIALSSLYAVVVGYTRIPYAAAKRGEFFSIFAHEHPTRNFPDYSLLILGAIALVFSMLFRMKEVINAILAMRIIVQFIGQAVGLYLLRKQVSATSMPYTMRLYPLPLLISIAMWAALYVAIGFDPEKGLPTIAASFVSLALGSIVYWFVQQKKNTSLTQSA